LNPIVIDNVWFLCKILQFDDKKKGFYPYKDFLGFVLKNSPYFEEKMSKVATFKHSIHGVCQFKARFGKHLQPTKTIHVGQSSFNFNQTFRTK
jgi:hypothetical protein